MDREKYRELALLIVAVSGSMMTNLAVNGLSPATRDAVLIVMTLFFFLGGFVLIQEMLPLGLRSRVWAGYQREIILGQYREFFSHRREIEEEEAEQEIFPDLLSNRRFGDVDKPDLAT